jgi:mono/diheme cytochrome c family protein
MKSRAILLAAVVALALLFLIPAGIAVADDSDVPPEYAGLTNPFPWDDANAQKAGKAVYEKSCQGCHGATGGTIAAFSFNSPEYAKRLEGQADLVYWVLTEGRMSKGMPGYKSSISDEGRWQVLTYIWSLGTGAAEGGSNPATPTGLPWSGDPGGTIMLTAPPEATAGEPFQVSVFLLDSHFEPFEDATVKFFVHTNFFMDGWMEIGEAVTDAEGNATAELVTRLSGDLEIAARYGLVESVKQITVADAGTRFYHPEAGLRLPAPGDEVFIGPESAVKPSPVGEAPATGFRLPGGILSWVLLLVAAVGLSWGTYLRVMLQVYRIPAVRGGSEPETKLLPMVGMVFLAAVGLMLMLMLLTGPQSNFHLVP